MAAILVLRGLYNNFDQIFQDNIGYSVVNIARSALSVPGIGIISLGKVISLIFSAHLDEFGYRELDSERYCQNANH